MNWAKVLVVAIIAGVPTLVAAVVCVLAKADDVDEESPEVAEALGRAG